MPGRRREMILGAAALVLGLFAALVWVPLDSETPPIYEFRRQTHIGDAMLPMVAALGLAICGALQLLVGAGRPADAPFTDFRSTRFLAAFLAIVAVSGALTVWAGPAALALFGPDTDPPVSYRLMRGTAPWKYIGFALGGTVLVFGLTSLLEARLRASRLLIAVCAVALLIALLDGPFDTLLLPPNGDH